MNAVPVFESGDGGPRVVLLLPGQGSQHQGMAHELYRYEPAFAEAVDQFFDRCGPTGGQLRSDWLADDPVVPLADATRAQPLLFVTAYAIGRLLERQGVRVQAAVGHSVGELTAAALAGVFDEAAGARIMLARSRSMRVAPHGGMVAIGASGSVLRHLLPELDATGTVDIGAENSPSQAVLCGPEPALSRTCAALRALGMPGVAVPSRQPFHSTAMAAAAAEFSRGVARELLSPPRFPIYSTRTAALVSDAEAVQPGFWGDQLRRPVLYWRALERMFADVPDALVVETGPGQVLSTIARRHPAVRGGRATVLAMLPGPRALPRAAREHWRRTLDTLLERAAAA